MIPSANVGRFGVLRFKVLFAAMLLAFVVYGIFNWVLWPVRIMGDSMLPSYQTGERHFINKLAYFSDKPQRGDVVGLRVSNGDIYIKRIIGLPGEEISFTNGAVFINGRALKEAYINTRVPWVNPPAKLGPDTYYVMGDNRAVSVLGPIHSHLIIGKVVY